MGIRGLHKNLVKIQQLWEPFEQGCKVVIDGPALVYYLWRQVENVFDGSYNHLYKLTEEFINEFGAKNIIKVVMDGCTEPNKFEKVMHRRRFRASEMRKIQSKMMNQKRVFYNKGEIPLLPFTEVVVEMVLEKYNIQVETSSREADDRIAEIAIQENAVVLSSDSDFYLFNLVGYMPFDRWERRHKKNSIYRFNNFCDFYSLKPEQAKALAGLIGDDFTPINKKTFKLGEALMRIKTISNNNVIYRPLPTPLQQFENHQKIHPLMLDVLEKNTFLPNLLVPVNVWDKSLKIRQHIYYTLGLVKPVKECKGHLSHLVEPFNHTFIEQWLLLNSNDLFDTIIKYFKENNLLDELQLNSIILARNAKISIATKISTTNPMAELNKYQANFAISIWQTFMFCFKILKNLRGLTLDTSLWNLPNLQMYYKKLYAEHKNKTMPQKTSEVIPNETTRNMFSILDSDSEDDTK